MWRERFRVEGAICASGLLTGICLLTAAGGQLRIAEQPPDVDKIIKQFAAKESAFQEARNYYTFRQEVRIQTIGFSNQATGEYYRVSDILFDDSGHRSEKILKFPSPSLKDLMIIPTYTFADDTLDFAKGQSIHMRMEVRYTNYKRFSSDVKIVVEGDEEPSDQQKSSKTPAKSKKE